MASYLNMVGADRYGVLYHADAVIDPVANRQLYRLPPTAHPIVRQLPLFLWMTGSSLAAPLGYQRRDPLATSAVRQPGLLAEHLFWRLCCTAR